MQKDVSNCIIVNESVKKAKGVFDGQLSLPMTKIGETNRRPNQSNVVFGPMKRKKGVFYLEMMMMMMMVMKKEFRTVFTGYLNPERGKHLHNTM